MLALQAPLSGGALFVAGKGRSGVVWFSTAPAEPGTDWETLAAEDADLQVAAEVVVGRSDLRELTALGMPRMDAAEVSWPELVAEVADTGHVRCESLLGLPEAAGADEIHCSSSGNTRQLL